MSVRVRCEAAAGEISVGTKVCFRSGPRRQQGATASDGMRRAADQLTSSSAPDAEIFCLDRHHRKNIGEVEDANQSSFAIGYFTPCLRGDDFATSPRGEVECGRLRVEG